MTLTLPTLSSAHSATVRTLCPTSRPMSHRKVTSRSTAALPVASGALRHQQQDVDVRGRVQLATAVAADGHQGPVGVVGAVALPGLAQHRIHQRCARVHQLLDRLLGEEAPS